MKPKYTSPAESNGDEQAGDKFRNRRLDTADEPLLKQAVSFLAEYFIESKEFEIEVWPGSLTLKHLSDRHRVIKVFFDEHGRLPGSSPQSMVLGFELTKKPIAKREMWRNYLAVEFGAKYIDPRTAGNSKYRLNPSRPEDHFYDLVIADDITSYDISSSSLWPQLRDAIKSANRDEKGGIPVKWPVQED